MLSQRGSIAIVWLVLVLLVLTGGAVYYFKINPNKPNSSTGSQSSSPLPSSIPTASPALQAAAYLNTNVKPPTFERIYTNTKYNYTLKLPDDWSTGGLPGEPAEVTHMLSLDSICRYKSPDICSDLLISTSPADTKNPYKPYPPPLLVDNKKLEPDHISEVINTQIGGEPAQGSIYTYDPYLGNPENIYYVWVTNHNGTKFTFTYSESVNYTATTEWKNKAIADTIISTFKFTN